MMVLSSPVIFAQDADTFELERLNFFPRSKSFFYSMYEHQSQDIDASRTSASTRSKSLQTNINVLSASYAYNVHKKAFVGLALTYEEASDNGLKYGLSNPKKFHSRGFREPEIFSIIRLREQRDDKGLIDLYLSYSDTLGSREIGNNSANRLNGKNIYNATLSHGLYENEWEFKTSLQFKYYDEGEESNGFNKMTYDLGSYTDSIFKFQAQYQLDFWCYVNAGIGFTYRGIQKVNDRQGDKREIQGGTGSLFELGFKFPVIKTMLAQINYQIYRDDYFVKSSTNTNFDGKENNQNISINIVQGY